MKLLQTYFNGEIKIFKIDPYLDERGIFANVYDKRELRKCGITDDFVRHYVSYSNQRTLRGLHFHVDPPRSKLIGLWDGYIYDVIVDIRSDSDTLGKWVGFDWYKEDWIMIYIPPGFAHGFYAESNCLMTYHMSNYYVKDHRKVLAWDDPDLQINWPAYPEFISDADASGESFWELVGKKSRE